MDVRCERCKAEYKLDETRIPPGGASVRCSACGHVFRVSKPGGGAEAGLPAGAAPPPRADKEWRLRQADGRVTTFKETSTLQRWIVELKASRDDELSPDGVAWRKLGDIPQLAPSFARADELRAAGRVAAPLETPTPVPGTLTPPAAPADIRRGTLPFAGVGEVGARPPAGAPAAPQEEWAHTPSEPIESPLTRTGRQFPVPPPPEEPLPEEGEATAVYDTSRLPPLAMPHAEEEAGTRFEAAPGLPPLAPAPQQPPLTAPPEQPAAEGMGAIPSEWEEAPPPEWEEAPATAEGEPAAWEEPHAAPTEQLPARPSVPRRQVPRWVVPAAAAGVLAVVAAVVAYSFWPQPTPPVRPRPGSPAGARAPAVAGAGRADAGTRAGPAAAAPATAARSRADAGTPAPARTTAPPAAPAPEKQVAAAPAQAPAPAPKAPAAGEAEAPAEAGAPAEGKEMFERWLTFGDRRLKEGDSHKALRAYARAAGIDPASPEPYVRRGRAMLGLDNPKGALTEFREALERDPGYGAALFGLAEANQALGNTAEARKAYQRYLQVLPKGPQAAEARARLGELESKQ